MMRLPNNWRKAPATLVIAGLITLCWLVLVALGRQEWAMIWGGFVPARLAYGGGANLASFWLTPLTSTLVHFSVLPLAMNLAALLFCGRAVESVLGSAALPFLYLIGACAAAGAIYLLVPHFPVPSVGAGGAISAVVGAYAVLFGRLKGMRANDRLARVLNALWIMAVWVMVQAAIAFIAQPAGTPLGLQLLLLAMAANAGACLVGILLANPLLLFRYRRA